MIRSFAAIALVTLMSSLASAQGLHNLCASAKSAIDRDADLAAATAIVIPFEEFADRDEDCLFPLKVLRYGAADVLLMIGNKPGEACHGCSANMSAYVLQRTPGSSRLVARFIDFGQSGTFGDPGRIDAVHIAGHDAFAIESGGTFQGYSSTSVTFYLFEGNRLAELKPSLPLSANNGGSAADPRQAISVDGAWRINPGSPDAILVDYKVDALGRKKTRHVVWLLKNDKFALKSGAVPPELKAAGGG